MAEPYQSFLIEHTEAFTAETGWFITTNSFGRDQLIEQLDETLYLIGFIQQGPFSPLWGFDLWRVTVMAVRTNGSDSVIDIGPALVLMGTPGGQQESLQDPVAERLDATSARVAWHRFLGYTIIGDDHPEEHERQIYKADVEVDPDTLVITVTSGPTTVVEYIGEVPERGLLTMAVSGGQIIWGDMRETLADSLIYVDSTLVLSDPIMLRRVLPSPGTYSSDLLVGWTIISLGTPTNDDPFTVNRLTGTTLTQLQSYTGFPDSHPYAPAAKINDDFLFAAWQTAAHKLGITSTSDTTLGGLNTTPHSVYAPNPTAGIAGWNRPVGTLLSAATATGMVSEVPGIGHSDGFDRVFAFSDASHVLSVALYLPDDEPTVVAVDVIRLGDACVPVHPEPLHVPYKTRLAHLADDFTDAQIQRAIDQQAQNLRAIENWARNWMTLAGSPDRCHLLIPYKDHAREDWSASTPQSFDNWKAIERWAFMVLSGGCGCSCGGATPPPEACFLFIPHKDALATVTDPTDLTTLALVADWEFDNFKILERWADRYASGVCGCTAG